MNLLDNPESLLLYLQILLYLFQEGRVTKLLHMTCGHSTVFWVFTLSFLILPYVQFPFTLNIGKSLFRELSHD